MAIPNHLKELQEKYDLQVDPKGSSEDLLILRSPIATEEAAMSFLKEFRCCTRTSWVVYKSNTNPSRIIYHKCWKCQHSNYRKVENSKRRADCEALIDIMIKKVNKNTKRTDSYLSQRPPLPCVIKLKLQHSHSTESAATNRMLRVDDEVKSQYEQYFMLGLGAAEAKHLHQSEILSKPDGHILLDDTSQNPTQRQINYLYDTWRNENLSSMSDPLQKLVEKLSLYEAKDCIVKVLRDTPWAVLVVTPVMQRTQRLPQSSEMIFMNSMVSTETSQSTMTVMLTATRAGSVPIAAFIQENQTIECYRRALQLLKTSFSNCFGGEETPKIFMTDDSAAEKGALKDLWPTANQLLNQFHVGQAEWRWLQEKYSEVFLEDRKRLIKLFQAVMYADSLEAMEAAKDLIYEEADNYPKFVQRFRRFALRRNEWLSLDRNSLLTQGNSQNDFSEATIQQIIKDVLARIKTYNVTALVDAFVAYCAMTWEEDTITKLLDYAYCRRKSPSMLFKDASCSMEKYDERDIHKTDVTTYVVPSATLKDVFYSIDTSIGVCTCEQGSAGAFCKHQAFLIKHLNMELPNALFDSSCERRNLAFLALGEKCPQVSFFESVEDMQTEEIMEPSLSVSTVNENLEQACSSHQTVAYATSQERDNLISQMQLLVPEKLPKNLANNLSKLLGGILKSNQQVKTLRLLACLLKIQLKKLHVQPTTLSRKRPCVTIGRGCISSGRPNNVRKLLCNRRRNLADNINKNMPNAK